MYRCDRHSGNDGVELIQATDSLRRIKPTDGFLPSKMSHQPIRVVQPPTQPSTHSRIQRSSQGPNSTRYDNLVQTAEQQRRLIDTNRRMIQEREARGSRIDNAPIRLAVLRNEILYEEREMARLKMMEREAQQAAARRAVAEKQLSDLQMNYTSHEQHLRNVISKIASLQTQLDILRRRRLIALNAAREQQLRLMSSQIKPTYTDSGQKLSTTSLAATSNCDIILRNDNSGSKSSVMVPQRTVTHKTDSDTDILRRIPPFSDSERPKCPFDLSCRPRASVEPFQVADSMGTFRTNRPKLLGDTRCELSASCPPQLMTKTFIVSAFGKDRTDLDVVDRSISPSPPKDPYPTADMNENAKEDERTLDTADYGSKKLPSFAPELMGKHSLKQESQKPLNLMMKSNSALILEEQCATNPADNTKLTRADHISIRPDTLRAAKRRSWVLQDSASCDETEYIRKILLDEQKKGRTHLLVGYNLGNVFTVSNKNATTVNKSEIIHEEEKEAVEETSTTPTEYVCELLMKDIQLDELPVEIEQVEESGLEGVFISKGGDLDELSEELETKNKISGIAELIKPSPERGILRLNKVKNASRKVVFDPLALLLDAALEGEMDLVKTSAAKLLNISACNDEGITALHNAICAGHYEIVRYLVDSFADVNAQDSDGWTPLHCAASCNNLPMVKLLVESGACIFAQTLSDLETPAEKCEEDEDGYEGCQLYLKAADQGAGVVNNGLMYAAYDYDKEQEDELSFQVGTCLRVLEKGVEGKTWWLCETAAEGCAVGSETSEQGLVPRNYLSLYPSLSRRDSTFKMFDLPQLPKIHESKKDDLDMKVWRRSDSVDDDKIASNNNEEISVELTLPISVS